jgi:hypothetical protein
MAKYGSSVVTVTIDDAPGGTPRNITPYVREIGGMKLESLTQQSNPFGTSSEAHTPTGMDKVSDITISGFFDDTAVLGPKVVFGTAANWALDKAPASVGRVLVIVAATGATFTITVHLVSYEVMNKNGNLTEYAAVVRQKSTGVWS